MKQFRSLFVGVALMGLAATHANAQATAPVQAVTVLPLVSSTFPPQGADPSAPLPAAPYNLTFQKSGRQASCDYVSLVARLQLDFQPGLLGDPQFLASVGGIRFDFADTLPAGLHIERVHLSGDVLAIPATINQTAGNPGEITIAGIQFDPAALTLTQQALTFEVAIDARIDRAAFATPSTITTQATLAISTSYGPYATMQSNDAAVPEDSDQVTGQPTALLVDVSGCPPIAQTIASRAAGPTAVSGTGVTGPNSSTVIIAPVGTGVGAAPPIPPAGGDACFTLIEGEMACSRNGTYVYRMPVGPAMAGKTVSFTSQTPGVWADKPSQIVPVGGATLEWTISGARPGMTLSFEVTGETSYQGPAEGWGLCCTRLIEIVVPVEDCPEPPPPPLVLKKSPENCPIGATECTFRLTVTNPGPNSYTGPVALVDNLTRGGATLAAAPPAPWRCSSPTTPIACAQKQVTLAAGQSLSLDLTLTGLTEEQRRDAVNCARLDLGLTSAQLPPGIKMLSTDDCVYAFVPEEPVPPEDNPEPKLTVSKSARTPTCTPDGLCRFMIVIANSGGSNYSGPISFTDKTLPGLGSGLVVNTGSGADFDCAASGPDAQTCTSKHDITLPAGATFGLASWVKVDPATIRQSGLQAVGNCASLQAAPGVADPSQSCAEMGLPPLPPTEATVTKPRIPAGVVTLPPPPPVTPGVQPLRPAPLGGQPPAPVALQPRAPAPVGDVPPAPVLLQPRQPLGNAPEAPVALQPRAPAPVGAPSAPVMLQPRQPLGTPPGAPVALQPRAPAPGPMAAPNTCPATMQMSADGRCVCPPGSTYDLRRRACSGAANAQTPQVAPRPVMAVPTAKAKPPAARPAAKTKPRVTTTKRKPKVKTVRKPKNTRQNNASRKPQQKRNRGADAEAIGKIFNGIMQMQRQPEE